MKKVYNSRLKRNTTNAKKYRGKAHPLAKFVGIWAEVDVESMLQAIKKARTSKNMRPLF